VSIANSLVKPTATYTGENSTSAAHSPGALVTCSARPRTNVGTYGQVALGIAGQVVGTGWLGYLRGDYRFGEHINGYSLNGGLRYQFTPDPAPMAPKGLITKAPPMMATAYNWTGMYIGANFGAATAGPSGPSLRTVTSPSRSLPARWRVARSATTGRASKWVFGVEGMVDWTNARGASPCPGNASSSTAKRRRAWYATATAKRRLRAVGSLRSST
jgi:hypothetical protein